MDTLGTAGPTPVGPTPEAVGGGWTTPFPAAPVDADSWRERMAGRGPAPCDGLDRHVLSMSRKAKAVLAGVAVAVLALTVGIGQFDHFGVYGVGLILGAVIASGYSLRVDGDALVAWRYGSSRRVALGSIVRLERYSYRGSVSLRTWKTDGHRGPSIPVSGRLFHLDPGAAGHLLRYLDRPEVTWGPGAWQLLSAGSDRSPATAPPGWPPAPEAEPCPPKGTEAPAKAPSRWARVGLWSSLGAIAVGTVVLLVVAPVSWAQYMESQRIQHGPQVNAALRSEWITQYSDRSGTHHTTHFDVAFLTLAHRMVLTEVDARGSWTMERAGSLFPIRYDPGAPMHAELPGAPDHTLASAIVPTVTAALMGAVALSTGLGIRRARRRRERLGAHALGG